MSVLHTRASAFRAAPTLHTRKAAPVLTASTSPAHMHWILFTLMMEMIRSYEMSALTRATLRHVLEDGILHSQYVNTSELTCWCIV
jgi:hypothetical protein